MGVAPSVPIDQAGVAVIDENLLQQQQQEERISIVPTPVTKRQSPDDHEPLSFCFAAHATKSRSRSNSPQASVPVLTMSDLDEGESSCDSMEEHAKEQEQDEQVLFPSLQRSQSFDIYEEGLGPDLCTQQAPFSDDSEVSSLVSASFTCTPRVVDVYQTNQTIRSDDDPYMPCVSVLPFRRCSKLRCHCQLWTAVPSLSKSDSNLNSNTSTVNVSSLGGKTRVRARSEECTYASSLATSPCPPFDASSFSSISTTTTTSSPHTTTRNQPMISLPRSSRKQQQHQDLTKIALPPRDQPFVVYNKQRSRSEDVVDIRSIASNTNTRLSQSERVRSLYKSQSERTVVVQPTPKLRSRSEDFVDGHLEPPPVSLSNSSRRNPLPPSRKRIIQGDFTPIDRANSEAMSVASSNSSVCIGRQLAPKKYAGERSPRPAPTLPRLRSRSEDLVDVPNHSHQQVQGRHTTNTQAITAAAAKTESLEQSRRCKTTPASPTSVMDLSPAAELAALASEESQQQPEYKLTTINNNNNRKAKTLDELLEEAFRFESQGNPLLALETYRASLDASKRRRHLSTTSCNKLIHARIYHRMGLIHYQMGNYHPSLRVLEQALDVISLSYGCLILQDTLHLISGIRDVCELVTEISFSVARVHLSLGSIQDAKHAAKQGLEIVHNKKSSQVLFHKGLVVLGMVYELEGRWDDALSHYHQALAFQQQQQFHHHLGDHHHTSVAATISCIGNVYTKQGWLGPAMECFRESIRIYSLSKSSALDIGLTLASIGWIQWWCGDLASATKSTTDALYIVQAGLGDLHRNTCTIRYQYGLIQASQGHSDEALGTLRYVLHAQRLSLGNDHADVAITCDAIGDLYHHQLYKSKKAVRFFSKALDIRKRVWGKTHLLVATSYSRLGHVLEQIIGSHSESRAYLAKTLAVYQANQLPLSDFRVQREQQALGRPPPSESVAW